MCPGHRFLGLAAVFATWAVTIGAFGCVKVATGQSPTDGDGGLAAQGGAGGDDAGGASGTTDAAPDAALLEVAPPSVCGNGIIEIGEECDDGNTISGDGCSSTCFIEPHYTCPVAAKPCVHDVICGDGRIEGSEQCDDGNTKSGDGCSSTCMLECGWECPPGAACRAAKCGDGVAAGAEQCDDGNTISGDGCSATCTLESKPASQPEGWICTSPKVANGCVGPTTCTTTMCGNGIKEGSEQCDDSNTVSGDGCSPFCRLEPVCPPTGGPCATVCGSGLLLPGDLKECDDGNTVSGDGCSSGCKVEPGFKCQAVPVDPNPLILPIVYHDFQSWQDPHGHPDFEHYLGPVQPGIAQPMLSTTNGGVPVHVPMCVALTTNLCAPPANASPTWDPNVDWFGMWYVDTPAYNKTIVQTLTLPQIAGGAFQFTDEAFFPLDSAKGTWGLTPGQVHNFGFTSVTRYWFEYSGAATLTFVGDDDVFVFINKTLAVDLGGVHVRATGSITLDPADGTGYTCDFVAPGPTGGACDPVAKTGGHIVTLGLVAGKVHEIAVFQAERHTVDSHYQLTLSHFSGTKSVCMTVCGDGVVTPPEMCDLGAANNTGAYGGCNPDCTLAPYCGDGIVQVADGEQCDSTPNCDKNCKFKVVP